jgi:hypothetical protein
MGFSAPTRTGSVAIQNAGSNDDASRASVDLEAIHSLSRPNNGSGVPHACRPRHTERGLHNLSASAGNQSAVLPGEPPATS